MSLGCSNFDFGYLYVVERSHIYYACPFIPLVRMAGGPESGLELVIVECSRGWDAGSHRRDCMLSFYQQLSPCRCEGDEFRTCEARAGSYRSSNRSENHHWSPNSVDGVLMMVSSMMILFASAVESSTTCSNTRRSEQTRTHTYMGSGFMIWDPQ